MQGRQVKRKVVDPVTEFLRTEQGGGFALLLGAVAALLWVNLGGIGGYESFWTTELRIGIGDASITEDLRHWVNDGLMALFFFERGLLGAAALAGIGFTVSLFITPLAYADVTLIEAAKLGILAGSVVSAACGIAILAPGARHPSRE